jgi:hypothetical protein
VGTIDSNQPSLHYPRFLDCGGHGNYQVAQFRGVVDYAIIDQLSADLAAYFGHALFKHASACFAVFAFAHLA